ncbi:hypothetical protein [Paraflavitalea pollutisoli]|uniref:hypothetical protein n=1 Tax=Paraflavitalea pollutisoli TaxID=3034143 RepID=UPI0023EBAE23|nr:hypothetical protein [Paraflavitalea sp. H1-2-19X]
MPRSTPNDKTSFTLNRRLLLIHFLAYWFIGEAFYSVAHLWFTPLIEAVSTASPDENVIQQLARRHVALKTSMPYYLAIPFFTKLAGLLIALILGILLCRRRHWSVFSTVIAWLTAFVIGRFINTQISLRFLPRTFALLNNTILEFLLPGMIFALMGGLLFFNRRSLQYIDAGEPGPIGQQPAGASAS